jgi:hypothetical protein
MTGRADNMHKKMRRQRFRQCSRASPKIQSSALNGNGPRWRARANAVVRFRTERGLSQPALAGLLGGSSLRSPT